MVTVVRWLYSIYHVPATCILHMPNKYFPSIYSVPRTVLGLRNTAVHETCRLQVDRARRSDRGPENIGRDEMLKLNSSYGLRGREKKEEKRREKKGNRKKRREERQQKRERRERGEEKRREEAEEGEKRGGELNQGWY